MGIKRFNISSIGSISPPVAPTGFVTEHTTFDDLASTLAAGAVGDLALLNGPSAWIGLWMKTASTQPVPIGPVRLWASDGGAEFTVGTTTDGTNNIERFDVAAAPTWGAEGAATGGLITNGSGALVLPFLGVYDPTIIKVAARCVATTVAETAAAGFSVGLFSSARTKGFLGGAYFNSASYYRKWAAMSSAPTITPETGGLGAYDIALANGDDILCSLIWFASDRVTNFGGYLAGASRGDEVGGSTQQRGSVGTSSVLAAATDHEVVIHHTDAGGDPMSTRWTEIIVSELSL